MQWELNYREPAKEWIESLPLGNGEIGAMVSGGTRQETIELNLDTLWSGSQKQSEPYPDLPDWNHIRKLVFESRYNEAEEYAKSHILRDWTAAYLPVGTVDVQMLTENGNNEITEYKRELSLNDALHTVHWIEGGVTYQKETFVSMSDNVLVMKISTDSDSEVKVHVSLRSQMPCVCRKSENMLVFEANAPVYAAPNYYQCEEPIRYKENSGIKFGIMLKPVLKSGTIEKNENGLTIRTSDNFYIILTGKTDFDGCDNIIEFMSDILKCAEYKGYKQLKQNHLETYHSFFDRLDLHMGESDDYFEKTDTIQQMKAFEKGENTSEFATLLFHYARYLMICSSKPGTQAANLQGIWNNQMRAPWSSNYTVNINTEMNYWMAESCNLGDCHTALFELIDRTVKKGKITAQKLYGLEGWVSHHNIDIWGNSDPVGKYAQDGSPCQYALWPMSSAWLCRHMWEHYCYTLDGDFLKDRAYPVIREAVRFYLGYLTEYDGYLVTCPSTSPENCFLDRKGEKHSVTFASTMDISILKELFATYLQICKILKVDVLEKETEFALKKLPPFKIGHDGQLQEWYRDYRETDIHHRHVSHLYGLYPGNVIKETDQELKKACEISLNRRGSQGTGWCMVWKASLWARLKNGEKAFELLKNQVNLTHTTEVDMSGGGIYPNLFCAHPPFQIDGNFGFAAAISEMLLQSQNNDIELLPAIPEQWKRGQIKGIKARGGYTVDFSWKNGKVYYIKISALKEGNIIVRYNGQISRFFFKEGQNKVCLQKTGRK